MNPSDYNVIKHKYKQGIMLSQSTIGDLIRVIDELDGMLAYMQACFSVALDSHRELMQRLDGQLEGKTQPLAETAAQYELIIRLLASGNLEGAQAVLNPPVVNEPAD